MRDKLLEEYMVDTFDYINDSQNKIIKDGKVSKNLKTIAASFGPNVYTMGLLSTWRLYGSKKGDYGTMLSMLWDLYTSKNPEAKNEDSQEYVNSHKNVKDFRRHLLCASVAIKLTLRTYDEAEN